MTQSQTIRRLVLFFMLALTASTFAQDDLSVADPGRQSFLFLERFMLVDAAADTILFEITEGMVIDLSTLPVSNEELNVLVIPGSERIGSVRFDVNRIFNFNTENIAPYTLFRNEMDDYYNGELVPGDYVLTATPFTLRNASGLPGVPLRVRFRVIEAAVVQSFTLVDAATNSDVMQITDGMTLDFGVLPVLPTQVNIRANVDPESVGSVGFTLSGPVSRSHVENVVPYALFENIGEDYLAGTLLPGGYTLIATPYSAAEATGTSGIPLTINFNVEYVEADTAPFVVSTDPVNGAEFVPPTSSVDITFSEPVLLAGLDFIVEEGNLPLQAFQLNCSISGTRAMRDFAILRSGNAFTFDPFLPFVNGDMCEGVVSAAGVSDVDTNDPPNNMLDDYIFRFNVNIRPPDAAPSVIRTSPVNGAIAVPISSPLSVVFSERVAVNSGWFGLNCTISGALDLSAFTVETTDSMHYTLTPLNPLAKNETCTGTISAASVNDLDTNDPPDLMVADYVFSFSTVLLLDNAPFVTGTTPVNGATDIPVDQVLSIVFSEAVAVNSGWFGLNCTISGALDLSAFTVGTTDNVNYTLTPLSPLANNETCTGTVSAAGVSDVDSNDPPDLMAADYVFSFSTVLPPDDAPFVTGTTPVDGAVDVPASANISLSFSEPVTLHGNWFTLNCTLSGSRGVAGFAVSSVDNMTYTLDPILGFANAETCTATVVAAGVSDQDSNDPPDTMVSDVVFSFTTLLPPDDAPFIVSVNPANGATNVAINTNIGLTFSEAVTLNGGWLALDCSISGIRGVSAVVVSSVDNINYTLDPIVDFAEAEACTGTIFATGVSDVDSNDPPDLMVSDYVFSFSTVLPPDEAPFVASTTPAANATGVALGASVIINFSEPVTTIGDWTAISCAVSGVRVGETLSISTIDQITYTLTPLAPFVLGERCTVGIGAANIVDVDTNDPPDNMAADVVFSFVTETDPAPTVFSTSPVPNATQVARNANVQIGFSEPVSAPIAAFSITCDSGPRVFVLTTSDNVIFTLNPNTDFGPNERCTVFIESDLVTDLDTNDPEDNLATDVTFSFTTRG